MSRKRKTLRIPVRKHPGVFVLVDEDIWIEYLRLGFSESISLDGNGSQHSYVRTMAWLPDPTLPRSIPIAVARIVVAIDAKQRGKRLPPKGWIVRYKNGDTLDLRIENLEVVPAGPSRSRNSFYAHWTVDHRWEIAETGGAPKKVFEQRRRDHRRAIKSGTHASESAPPSPRGLPPVPGPSDKGGGIRSNRKGRRGKP